MAKRFGPEVLVGAGTVLDPADVDRVRDAGGRLVVMPHGDAAVIARAVEAGLACTPGVATPTEAFAALKCGAAALKMFPAENLPPVVVKAWRAVVPKDTLLLPVGGINPDNMAPYVEAGADGFGLGSALFSAERDAGDGARQRPPLRGRLGADQGAQGGVTASVLRPSRDPRAREATPNTNRIELP